MNSLVVILSKTHSAYIEKIKNVYKNTIIIFDTDYADNQVTSAGFHGLTQIIKNPSAYDKIFYKIHIEKLYQKFDRFYFIEDDVYSKDINSISSLIIDLDKLQTYDLISLDIGTKIDSTDWCWWENERDYKIIEKEFNLKYKSFNPFCALSSNLILECLKFKNKYDRFIFHEILFSSLCADRFDKNFLDIRNNKSFGSFWFRPLIEESSIQDNLIYHPVKPNYVNNICTNI